MPFHGLRSRSRSRCKQVPQGATPRPSTDSRDSSSSLSSTHSRESRESYHSAESVPPVPPLPAEHQHHARKDSQPHPSVALFPFLANLPRFAALPDENIDLWLHAVDTIADHVGAAPDAPVPLIPLLLRGDAFKRFVRMHHATRGRLTSWPAWKEHLRAEFRGANYLAARRAELAARAWRQSDETLAAYFDKRRALQIVALPDAGEEELVQDVLSGIPLRQRRLVVDTIPHAQRLEPSLAVLRRAMVDCEVEMRGRGTLRGDRLELTRRMHSTSPGPRSPVVSTPPSSFLPPPTITVSG